MDQVIQRLLAREQHKPWAILPRYFDGMIQASGPERPKAFLFAMDVPQVEPLTYTIGKDSVATIRVHGVLLKEPDGFDKEYLGAVSTVEIADAAREALADVDTVGLVLDIDSPGGTVDGSFALADAIYALRGEKPIVAFVDGLAASAGYLLASAADRIVITQSGEAGSIGVRMTVEDWSKWNEKAGITVNIIASGKYKAAGDMDIPLDSDAKAYFQNMVNQFHLLFVDKISAFRGIAPEAIAPVADGRTFIASDAVASGLTDQIGELADARSLVLTYQKTAGETPQERTPVMGMIDAVKRLLAGKPLDEGDPEEATEIVEAAKAALVPKKEPVVEAPAPTPKVEAPDLDVAKAERERSAAIMKAGRALNLDAQFVEGLVAQDCSLAQAQTAIIEKAAESQNPLPPTNNRLESPDAASKAAEDAKLIESARKIAEARK